MNVRHFLAASRLGWRAGSRTVPSLSRFFSMRPENDLVVVALGGNALLQRGEKLTADNQRRNAQTAAEAIARVIRSGYRVCVTHGNGPQVGLLALLMPEAKLDVLDAQTEGSIGYIIEVELSNALQGEGEVVTMLTQVVVSKDDPAFKDPTKFIGPQYDEEKAAEMKKKGYTLKLDGDMYRRVVASPTPLSIVEANAIRLLLENGMTVVCTGGGGIPVTQKDRERTGIDAVVDKDHASRVLAELIGAKYLLLLTDADGVYVPGEYGKKGSKPLGNVAAGDLEREIGNFPAGSMQPKVASAVQFATSTPSGICGIGRLADALEILRGTKGTRVEATQTKGHL